MFKLNKNHPRNLFLEFVTLLTLTVFLPFSQRSPKYPDGQKQVLGDRHFPPFSHDLSQIAENRQNKYYLFIVTTCFLIKKWADVLFNIVSNKHSGKIMNLECYNDKKLWTTNFFIYHNWVKFSCNICSFSYFLQNYVASTNIF